MAKFRQKYVYAQTLIEFLDKYWKSLKNIAF